MNEDRLIRIHAPAEKAVQTELFELTIAQRFAIWKETPGGGQILRRMYEIASGYYKDFQRYGTKVSQRLIWEQIRHRINLIEARLRKSGKKLDAERGFCLNNDFTAHAVRHMIANYPEWRGMFELREIERPRAIERKTVTVKTEKILKVA